MAGVTMAVGVARQQMRITVAIAALVATAALGAAARAGGSPPLGGDGGAPLTRACPADRWLAGFDARIHDGGMSHAGPLCVALDVSAHWRDSPEPIGTQDLDVRGTDGRLQVEAGGGALGFGTSGDGQPYRLQCPRDAVVVGLGGTLDSRAQVLARLTLLCRAPDGSEVPASMPADLRGRAMQFVALGEVRCPAHETARGVSGGASRYVDRLALDCAGVPALLDRVDSPERRRSTLEPRTVPVERHELHLPASPTPRPPR